MATADPREIAVTGHGARRRRDLLWALAVHALALIAYGALVIALFSASNWDPLGPNSAWSTLAAAVAGWLWFAGGTLWLLGLVNLIRWWFQGRQGLVQRTIAFDSLLWLGPWLAALLAWKRTHRLIVPAGQPRPAGHTHRVRRLALLLGLLVVVGLGVGWAVDRASRASHPRLAHVSAIAGRSLGIRRVVFSFGSRDYRDVWVLSDGRLRQISREVRIATGGRCYGDPGYGGSSGPCYELAEPLSVSRNGRYIAYFLQDTVGAPDTSWPALIGSRVDGSDAHRLATKLAICPLCTLSAPSWDRASRSFVIAAPISLPNQAAEDNPEDFDEDTALFRIEVSSGRAVPLTNRAHRDTYNDAFPSVSPAGRRIAFLRSAAREPSNAWFTGGLVAFVYVMRANGKEQTRLPLPPRAYSRLWWCEKNSLCATASNARSAAATYRIDLQTRLVTRLRHWPEAATDAVSPNASFALEERKTGPHRFELLAGPVNPGGLPRLKPILVSSDAKGNPFGDFSVSGP